VEERGLPATIENFRKFSDLPSLGFKTEVVIVGGEKRTRIDDCILASVWKELGKKVWDAFTATLIKQKLKATTQNLSTYTSRTV
jgi:hypothetical protein